MGILQTSTNRWGHTLFLVPARVSVHVPALAFALALALALALLTPHASAGQVLVDTTYTWRAYASVARCRVRIFETTDVERSRLVVVGESAANPGPSIMDDARYLVANIARDYNLPPEQAHWVFHWGWFSHEGADTTRKELFLRARFKETDGAIATPQWRVVTREDLEELTDRAFR